MGNGTKNVYKVGVLYVVACDVIDVVSFFAVNWFGLNKLKEGKTVNVELSISKLTREEIVNTEICCGVDEDDKDVFMSLQEIIDEQPDRKMPYVVS